MISSFVIIFNVADEIYLTEKVMQNGSELLS